MQVKMPGPWTLADLPTPTAPALTEWHRSRGSRGAGYITACACAKADDTSGLGLGCLMHPCMSGRSTPA